MEDSEIKKFNLEYHEDESVRSYYINGVYGGISPRGEIIVKFFREGIKTPDSVDLFVNSEGKIIKEEQKFSNEKGNIVRKVLVEIIMTPEQAKSIAEWLNNKANEFETIAGK